MGVLALITSGDCTLDMTCPALSDPAVPLPWINFWRPIYQVAALPLYTAQLFQVKWNARKIQATAWQSWSTQELSDSQVITKSY